MLFVSFCTPEGERIPFHIDAVTLVCPDEITACTEYPRPIAYAEIFDNTVFPAVKYTSHPYLLIFKDFFPAPCAFYREHEGLFPNITWTIIHHHIGPAVRRDH